MSSESNLTAYPVPTQTTPDSQEGLTEFPWKLVCKGMEVAEDFIPRVRKRIGTLEKHLQSFDPEAVHLYIHIEKIPKTEKYEVKMVLSLPEHLLKSEKRHAQVEVAVGEATKALVRQLEALKARLRGEPLWKRKARRAKLRFATTPQAADQGPATVAEATARHYAQYAAELHHFVQRQLSSSGISDHKVADYLEAVQNQRSAPLSRRLAQLSDKARSFHIALQKLHADTPVPSPAHSGETISPPNSTLISHFDHILAHTDALVREVFDLYYIAGFELEDIAHITERPQREVEQAWQTIQHLLREAVRREALSPVTRR
ncbi:MAG: HPF/RaiA family ribosome-associated protein [Gemmataceae bacterium]|jgi:ribosome-associated translation inhibitor RaiA/DNA-directed RNA polymerase specialized sigma24 family protein|uniref:HPF/RaiA family ribosome-associated protein n=1 Tax=Thermogemmata fonticola TaxID=2755323 RepID=A0A7V8VFV5_9BACT|nr:HPF/RaiA family ribosome-associated protein [Thermogemmata fonticola]MBA2227278.1 HPF/RaiA family ribosome-associated protein [Thermogemmata fonticola]MCX8138656.1 HPF/RaiA family ribosome-associated protein [Gemmataceae bacterium]